MWAPIYAPSIKQQRLFGFTLTNRALVVQQTSFSSTPQAKLSTAELFAHLNRVQCSGVKFASSKAILRGDAWAWGSMTQKVSLLDIHDAKLERWKEVKPHEFYLNELYITVTPHP